MKKSSSVLDEREDTSVHHNAVDGNDPIGELEILEIRKPELLLFGNQFLIELSILRLRFLVEPADEDREEETDDADNQANQEWCSEVAGALKSERGS